MTSLQTFATNEVQGFIANLEIRVIECQNGEGTECATLDAALWHHSVICCQFVEGVRGWGRAVFSGRVEYDPETERIWKAEGRRLYLRARELSAHAQKSEVPCFELDGQNFLTSALWLLDRLLSNWVTPKRAVGVSARVQNNPDSSEFAGAKERIASLPPLPSDWQPTDHEQKALYRLIQKS